MRKEALVKRTLLVVAALGALLVAAAVQAQVLPEKPKVEKLKNGLTVVTLPWDSPGMVAFYSMVRTGSRDETDRGHTGFAHLFEHMMFRGTERFPKQVYEAKIQEFGADNNAFTWYDLTCYTVVLPTEVLPELIEIEADRFKRLKYSEADFKTETGAVLGEYNLYSANPALEMTEKLHETAFTRHTYGHTVIGYKADVEAMPGYFNFSKPFHRRFYTPDNTYLIVVGDFDRAAVLAKIEAEYGKWRGKRKKTRAKKEPPQKNPRAVHVPWQGPTASKMTLAYKVPAFDLGRQTAAITVLAELLFGESSPLYRKLVVDEQQLIELSATHYRFRDPYLLHVDATLKEGTTFDEIQEEVTAAIAEIAGGEIARKRVEAVKSHARYAFQLGLETPKDVATALALLMSATGDPNGVDKYAQALSEVTVDDVVAVAKAFLADERRTVVTLATEQKGGAK
jgi:zinc protease